MSAGAAAMVVRLPDSETSVDDTASPQVPAPPDLHLGEQLKNVQDTAGPDRRSSEANPRHEASIRLTSAIGYF